jgi:hypothetical protein
VKSTDVKFWDVRRNKSSKTASYEVRWVAAGKQRSRTRRTKALAESFLSDLRQAAKSGEAFDIDTGLPTSMLPKQVPVTWYELARTYIKAKWPRAAGETRKSTLDALATVTPALVSSTRGAPNATVLRRALLHYGLNPPRWKSPVPAEEAAALKWLGSRSLPVTDLAEADVIRSALNAIAVTMAGRPAAATTVARKRAVLYNVLKYAVSERKLLDANPIDQVDWKAPEKIEQVDRSVVANPAQARQLLAAVTYVSAVWSRGAYARDVRVHVLRRSPAVRGDRSPAAGLRTAGPVCLHRRYGPVPPLDSGLANSPPGGHGVDGGQSAMARSRATGRPRHHQCGSDCRTHSPPTTLCRRCSSITSVSPGRTSVRRGGCDRQRRGCPVDTNGHWPSTRWTEPERRAARNGDLRRL